MDFEQRERDIQRAGRRATDAEAGFSLVELLVVLAIIGLLSALVAPRVLNYLSTAKVETAKIQIKNLQSALELFYIDAGRYPTNDEGLSALAKKPADVTAWSGPYLKDADMLKDPWGNAFLYSAPEDGGEALVKSLGRDGREGGSELDEDLP
ncbi:type II secretion system major pseudopilin GspG [Rhizobium alvei]|uniref:Type II secretion system core protein G n=1 Tax=Rhizobium alvei TaxID=1132659 RepID=A0ABT8YNI4_9HYPH|nr:type II secretion system major pseudopilin GspG [Rhizobium alvei]MDO6965238.1 type II secretion system major pseudopilin GspG [Rhizobium alvei]